jgi:hypothetical protein
MAMNVVDKLLQLRSLLQRNTIAQTHYDNHRARHLVQFMDSEQPVAEKFSLVTKLFEAQLISEGEMQDYNDKLLYMGDILLDLVSLTCLTLLLLCSLMNACIVHQEPAQAAPVAAQVPPMVPPPAPVNQRPLLHTPLARELDTVDLLHDELKLVSLQVLAVLLQLDLTVLCLLQLDFKGPVNEGSWRYCRATFWVYFDIYEPDLYPHSYLCKPTNTIVTFDADTPFFPPEAYRPFHSVRKHVQSNLSVCLAHHSGNIFAVSHCCCTMG